MLEAMTDQLPQIRHQPTGSGSLCRTILRALPTWFGIEQDRLEQDRPEQDRLEQDRPEQDRPAAQSAPLQSVRRRPGRLDMYKSLLVATDGSETAAEAVRVATELAVVLGARLHIANVYSSSNPAPVYAGEMTMAYLESLERGKFATAETEALAERARAMGLSAQPHVVAGNVAERIVEIAEEQHVELIVVGNKGMRGLKRVLGSVPNAVAHSAKCAVLIVNTT